MRLLGLVPARGGSKGIPRKNLAPLGGKPLLAWTVEAARASGCLDRLVVSTDDEEIAEAGRRLGAEVPFRRPAALADDAAPALGVIRHALQALTETGWQADAVLYLQPTSPFRRPEQIAAAARLIASGDWDAVVSVVRVPHNFTPGSLMRETDGRLGHLLPADERSLRRQEKPVLFARNGPAILGLTRAQAFAAADFYTGRTAKLEMGRLESLDIDEGEDLHLAEALLPLICADR